jgi:oxepin-CoA hydrolase/3-oxo-5,6-dehydrosuberyl-CoA semialdehyde dehydrogenase
MAIIRFDVNDPLLRETFIRDLLLDTLAGLRDDATPRWGKMTARQMVEHLEWTFDVSTGRAHVECHLPEAKRDRMKVWLHDNRPSPPGFMNPALVEGLPPLRHGGLTEARLALRAAVDRFFDQAAAYPGAIHTHPVFGPLRVEQWSRTHFKHGYHHLVQFGLIEPAEGG